MDFFSLCRWLKTCVTLSFCLCCWMLGCWSVVWTQLCILLWSLTCWLRGIGMWRRPPESSTRLATALKPAPCSCPTADLTQGCSPLTAPSPSFENGCEGGMWVHDDGIVWLWNCHSVWRGFSLSRMNKIEIWKGRWHEMPKRKSRP